MGVDLTAGLVFAMSALCLACFVPCMFGWFLVWRLAKQSAENARAAQIGMLAMCKEAGAVHVASTQAAEDLARSKTPERERTRHVRQPVGAS